jgi:predicted GNAT superfamily acetyltransferase
MNSASGGCISIRDIVSFDEMRQVERLQKQAWGFEDLDVIPLPMLVAAREVGGVLIGAFEGGRLLGFTFGFLGREGRHFLLHSHMLAVNPDCRNADVGRRLKMAQRERVLESGLDRVTWTFDPLQSLNAHLNFAKLGVVSASYRPNFYGESTSSHLHTNGTDRLLVTWLVASNRVARRLERGFDDAAVLDAVRTAPFMVKAEADGTPVMNPDAVGAAQLLIAIPDSAASMDAALARRWRQATREAFTLALDAGYLVEEFCRAATPGAYVLSKGKLVEDFE